jgi:hypothetical protein
MTFGFESEIGKRGASVGRKGKVFFADEAALSLLVL